MSQPQDGRPMDQPYGPGGSVRRARERAQAGLPPIMPSPPTEQVPAIPPPRRPIGKPNGGNRPQAPAGLQMKGGNIGLAISRPTPVAQWPLGGSIASPASSEGSEPYRPPPGKSQPPQRPPRPSRVPSMLDGSRVQDHTPVFQYAPQRASELSVPETPATSSSRPSTLSSVGSIPDFPLPTTAPEPPPLAPPVPPPIPQSRRSMGLGPPPSSRRGASSFYSTTSYVSPIPEESPRTRSHASYASSAAIPESFGTLSPGFSPDGAYFDDTIAEESVYSDDADESRLVRSASIGRKGKPSLVTTRSSERGESIPIMLPISRPTTRPLQVGSFNDGTGYFDGSSSSSGAASSNAPSTGAALTSDNMLDAFNAAGSADPASIRKATPSPRPYRLSALRRPPRLDIDAVRTAEARGSLTSLPDLIKRATRLAALMDRGRRPASRFDDLDMPERAYARDPEKEMSYDPEKHQSGFSDMLAAFPPPVQANNRRSVRQSRSSWPLAPGGRAGPPQGMDDRFDEEPPQQQSKENPPKKGRRCCGLPCWGFIVLFIIILIIIAAAVVVPVQLLVVQKQNNGNAAQSAITDCQSQLRCANGGTNVITQGICSCICSNGFTGTNCTTSSSQGCTTTSFASTGTNLNNVTLGQAIPRLVQEAQTNFSIPLSATTITSKFNAANLSCTTENALVTFNGRSSRSQDGLTETNALLVDPTLQRAAVGITFTVSVLPDVAITLTANNPAATDVMVIVSTMSYPTTLTGSISTIFQTTITKTVTAPTPSATLATSTPITTASSTPVVSATPSKTTSIADPTATFAVTDQVLDFARVAVLFVLQEQSLPEAATAQSTLQKFFTSQTTASGITFEQATNITMGGRNTVDLVHFLVDLGTGTAGTSRVNV